MIRLSVTDLETFRYWKDKEDGSVEDLIKDLRGLKEPSHEMLASRAFHSLMEHVVPGSDLDRVSHVDEQGVEWTFDFELDSSIFIPAIRELKIERPWKTCVGEITLVGKVDNLIGLTVEDYKLSARFEAERYTDSLQWRAYLVLCRARRFVYRVFQAAYDSMNPYHVRIYELHSLGLDAYPEMTLDVDEALDELAAFVKDNVPEKRAA